VVFHAAVQIWATQRFQSVEQFKMESVRQGKAMHSEAFVNFAILPAILAIHAPTSFNFNARVCFFQVQASGLVMISDCDCDKHMVFLNMSSSVTSAISGPHAEDVA
jgi:hypothetical protein